ncbi:MAG TPA: tetratricopeptide repeat protein [Anaerolineae bacterium]|nr:tetratricopeptide repeat protein [Anaerolineae bacterium]
MHRLVSPFILEKYAVGETSGDLTAASLFVDISGFSTITDTLMGHGQHGAEVMADLMRQIFTPLVEAVYAHDGFIATFAGDAFTALFPIREEDETALPKAAQRALAAGWTIRDAITEHPPYETDYADFEVGVKVGLATGEAHWQIVLAEKGGLNQERATFYFRGTAIDGAAQAEQQASRNMMILTAVAYELLQEHVTAIDHNDEYWRVMDTSAGSEQAISTDSGQVVRAGLPQPQPIDLPPVDDVVLRHFFPPKLLRYVQTDEFRQIVNLYIGLQGTPNDAQIIQFGQTLLDLQAQYGGLFNRLDFGDKGCNVVLFWGAPVAYENDVSRALNFILALQERSPIAIRAGVTQRIAHVGVVGSALQGEFTCTGNGVNLAARFMMKAGWGEVWLDAFVAEKGRREFELSAIGDQEVKGFAQPQMAYRLEEQKSFIARLYDHEMVGREAEAGEVRAFIEPILAEEADKRFAGILVVMGEAGLGKSRLVTDVQLSFEKQGGIQFALCQTDQIHRSSFNPFAYWLRNYFSQANTQSVARNKRAFNRKLDQLLNVTQNEELSKTLSQGRAALGSLIGLRWEHSAYEQLHPEGRYEWRLATLKALILAESLQMPLVIILEDVHWLDVESIAFVERLVRVIDAYPLAILATSRPTVGDKPLLGQVDYRRLNLSLLKAESMAILLGQVLAGSVADAVFELIVGRAEGNPFFGEQIALYLQEQGIISQQEGVWQLTQKGGGRYLPQDIRTIFTARLDQLADELKGIVQTAAILGREFEVQVLSGMLQAVEALPAHMQALEAETIWTALNQVRYLFKHALLRDAAYEMQVRAQRSQLHQLAAVTMERLYEADLAPHYEAIAEHYLVAYNQGIPEVGAKAVHYLQVTAQQLGADNEHQRVIRMVSHALDVVGDGVMGAETVKSRYDLWLLQEASYHLLGQRDEQEKVLQQLLALAETEPAWELEIRLRQIEMLEVTGAYDSGLEQAAIALALAQQLGDVGGEAAVAVAWGEIAWRQSRHEEAIERGEQGIQLAEIGERLDVLARGLNLLGSVARDQGRNEEAEAYHSRSLAIKEEIGDRRGVAESLNNLGVVAYDHGRNEEAVAYFSRSLAIKEEIGDRRGVAISLGNLGSVANDQGRNEEAVAYYSRALAIQEEIGDRQMVAISLGNLGIMSDVYGQYDEASRYFSQALKICEEIGDNYVRPYVLTGLGKVSIALGQFDKGITYLKQGIDLQQQQGHQALLMESLAVLGWGYWQEGNLSEALMVIEQVESYLAAGGSLAGAAYKWGNAWYCYQVLAAGGDERAVGRLAATYEGVMADVAKIESEAGRESFLENIPWHREIVAAYEAWNKEGVLVLGGGVAVDGEAEAVVEVTDVDDLVTAASPTSANRASINEQSDEVSATDTAAKSAVAKPLTGMTPATKQQKKRKKKKKKGKKGKRSVVINLHIEHLENHGDIYVNDLLLEALRRLLDELEGGDEA